MAASRYAQAFHVLAGTGGSDQGKDPSALAGQVAQIGELQSFMASYRDKLTSDAKPPTVN
jgi:hypothetical protein